MYRPGVGQVSSALAAQPILSTSSGPGITDAQSAANCAAGGGTYDPASGDCNAPVGGSLYTDQLAQLNAASCPWYCVPWLNYPSTSPCSDCQSVTLASPGGLPMWAWIGGLGLLAYALITAVKK